MNECTLILAQASDWQGLYLNEKLVTENHSVSLNNLVNSLDGIQICGTIISRIVYVDDDWLEEQGGLPKDLCDVKFTR